MSAAHRPGGVGDGYYAGVDGDVIARQRGDEGAAATWRSGYYPHEAGRSWAGGGAGGGTTGAQNSSYPGYSPNCWSCPDQPRPSPYPPSYQDQRMGSYTNGSYGPQYPPASMNPPYPTLQQPNHYFPPPSHTPYPVDPYKQSGGNPQAPPPHWGYPQHGGHSVSTQPQGYPQYPSHQQEAPPSYPYRETASGLPPQNMPPPQTMPQQSPQGEGWSAYGVPNPYQWPSAPPAPHNPASNHYMPGSRPAWPGADMQQTSYNVKDPSPTSSYNRQGPYQGYHPETPQTGPPAEPKPNPPNPHYSALPQMYNRKDPANQDSVTQAKEANPDPIYSHPGIVKINQILEKVEDLEREVDEFVGRKTDRSYRCLEELLTKELLELDSVETGGQDSVRQARKEAVRRLQSILERLERKGL